MEQIVHAFVSLHLDYCNTLFTGIDKSSLSHLQFRMLQPDSWHILGRELTLPQFYFLYISSQLILEVVLKSLYLHTDQQMDKLQTIYLNFLSNTLLVAVFAHNLKLF